MFEDLFQQGNRRNISASYKYCEMQPALHMTLEKISSIFSNQGNWIEPSLSPARCSHCGNSKEENSKKILEDFAMDFYVDQKVDLLTDCCSFKGNVHPYHNVFIVLEVEVKINPKVSDSVNVSLGFLFDLHRSMGCWVGINVIYGPTDLGTSSAPLIVGIWEHVNNYNYKSKVPAPAMRVLQNQYNYLLNKHIESDFKAHVVHIKLYNQISRSTQKGEICSSLATCWFKFHGNSGLDTSAIDKNFEILIGWLLDPLEQGDCMSDMKALLKNGFSIYCEVEKILMQIHDDEALVLYDKLFSYASPKYIALFAPTYEKPFVNCKLDSYKLQLRLFPYDLKQKQLLYVVQKFLKVYLTNYLGKLATYMEVDGFALRAILMTYKHKIHVDSDGNVISTMKLGTSSLRHCVKASTINTKQMVAISKQTWRGDHLEQPIFSAQQLVNRMKSYVAVEQHHLEDKVVCEGEGIVTDFIS